MRLIGQAYSEGILPLPWRLVEFQRDFYDRHKWRLENARGESIDILGPTQVGGLMSLRFGKPYFVVRDNILGLPNATLRFELKDAGPHETLWADFPLRREIPRRVGGQADDRGGSGPQRAEPSDGERGTSVSETPG